MTYPDPVVVIDTREQTPLPIKGEHVVGTLTTGDYSIKGLEERFAVERKTVADMVSCCCGDNRDRFERELARLRGFDFSRLLIIGRWADIETGNYRSMISSNSVIGSLSTWEIRYSVPIVCELTPEKAAERVERWAKYFVREVCRQAEMLLKQCA